MVRLRDWGAPHGHDFVANVFVQGAILREDHVGHAAEKLIEERHQGVRVVLKTFGDRREPSDVGEEDGELAGFTAEGQQLRMVAQQPRHFRRQIQTERVADLALFAFLQNVVLHTDRRVGEADGQQRIHQAQGQAVPYEENLARDERGGEQQRGDQRSVYAARVVQRDAENADGEEDDGDLDEHDPLRLQNELAA